MILTCPECATRYQTDAELFRAGGRSVRCAKCGHIWYQKAPAPEYERTTASATGKEASAPPTFAEAFAARPVADAAGFSAGQRTSESSARWGERIAMIAGWLGLAAILALIAWSAVAYRQAIASVWPESASFYKAIGLPVNAAGIAIIDVKSNHEAVRGQLLLIISGDLVNVTGHTLPVPAIRVTLSDAQSREVDRWEFSPGITVLKSKQKIAFTTRRANPPAATRNLEVTFSGAGG